MSMKSFSVGWASVDITPDRPVMVAGQMYPRLSSYVHDPLTATVLTLDNGDEQYTMVSADVVNLNAHAVASFRARLAHIPGLDPMRVSFNATHTHNSLRCAEDPHISHSRRFFGADRSIAWNPPDNLLYGQDEVDFVGERLALAVEMAWKGKRPGGIAFASDYAAVGFNRRPVFSLDSGEEIAKMYGACSQDHFLRFEGASDHLLNILYTFSEDGRLTGAAVNVNCPAQVYELHDFLSSDYWADARSSIRNRLGNIYVLPLCGAAGDQNPLDLMRLSKYNEEALRLWNQQAGEVSRNFDMARECQAIGERIGEAVGRGYQTARNAIRYSLNFRYEKLHLSLPIRAVSEADYQEALVMLASADKRLPHGVPMSMLDYIQVYEPMGVVLRWERQQTSPNFDFDVHIARLGNAVIATNPFELFAEYGIRMRARSKAAHTFIVQLCDDAATYLPTAAAVRGGSYSSKPATTVLGPDGGTALVEETLRTIGRLFS